MMRFLLRSLLTALFLAAPAAVMAMGGFDPSTLQQTTTMTQSDQAQQAALQQQMAQQAALAQQQRWQQMQDMNQSIFQIQQDVTLNRAKTQDKMFNQWDQYIRN